jgi:hypothetical protein
MVEAHLLVIQPTGVILKYFLQKLHQKLRINLLTGFLSRVLESIVFPKRMDLFLQSEDLVGQPMGGHSNSCQALLFQVIDFVGQSSNLGEFEWGRLFTPSPLEHGESANKRREAGFMVFIVEPCYVPSTKRRLHGVFKEAGVRAGLKTHAPNNLAVRGTRLIFQEEVIFE